MNTLTVALAQAGMHEVTALLPVTPLGADFWQLAMWLTVVCDELVFILVSTLIALDKLFKMFCLFAGHCRL